LPEHLRRLLESSGASALRIEGQAVPKGCGGLMPAVKASANHITIWSASAH
jgi:hypothetical protein